MKIDIHIHVLPRDRPWEHRHPAWAAGRHLAYRSGVGMMVTLL